MEHYSVIERVPFAEMWIDLETEWSKSDREKQMLYNITYQCGIWYLENWCRWTCLQIRNKDTDVEKKLWMPRGDEDELGGWDNK